MNKQSEQLQFEALNNRMYYKITVLTVLLVLLFIVLLLSVSCGAYDISVKNIINVLFCGRTGLDRQIIWNIRLPRTLIAGLVGMNLALAGAILQGVMRNPLASPSIIGVSAGAGMGGMLILIVFPGLLGLVVPCAFGGALITTVLIYLLAWHNGAQPMRIILAGVAVSAFLHAGINGLMVFFPDRLHGAVDFMVGGLAAKGWSQFHVLYPYSIAGVLLAFTLAKKLNILQLGDEMSTSLGLNVERARFFLIAVSSLLAASAVSVVGLLGFVGLIVPHMTRLIIGSDSKYLLPGSALSGAVLLMLCDTFARTIIEPTEIPVGIIMAILGAPFFLFLLRGGLKKKC